MANGTRNPCGRAAFGLRGGANHITGLAGKRVATAGTALSGERMTEGEGIQHGSQGIDSGAIGGSC